MVEWRIVNSTVEFWIEVEEHEFATNLFDFLSSPIIVIQY